MASLFSLQCLLLPLSLAGISLGARLPRAEAINRFEKRSFSTTGLNISAPGTTYDQEPVGFDFGISWVTPIGGSDNGISPDTYKNNTRIMDFNYALDNNGNLISHGANLCFGNGQYFGDTINTNDTYQILCGLASGNFYIYDNCKKVFPCPNTNSFGVWDGKWLTWGGSYDKWCSRDNTYNKEGLLFWVKDLEPYGSAPNPLCKTRVRVLINGVPAPSAVTSTSTTTTTTTTTPIPPPTTTTTTTTKPTSTTTTTTKPTTTTTKPTSTTTTTTTTKPTTTTTTPTTKPTTTTTKPSATTTMTTTAKPTTTTTTTKTPSSTTMTNTTVAALPNPKVTSAVNTASSYIRSASSAYSKYMSNTTNPTLGASARNALETAVIYIADAKAVAIAESVPDIASQLDDVADQLIEAAARAAILLALLTTAAADALKSAVDVLEDLFDLVFSSAKDPVKDPSPPPPKPSSPPPTGPTSKPTTTPTTTKTSTTTSTTTSGTPTPFVCSLCVACNDAALPKDDPDSTDGSDVIERSIAASSSGSNRGSFCQQAFNVPSHFSYSGAGNGNIYGPYYNYWESYDCGQPYDYKLINAYDPTIISNLAPLGYQVPNTYRYVTEHIYEIQNIEAFLAWLSIHGPSVVTSQGSAFCSQGLGYLLRVTPTSPWSSYGGFDYTKAPILQMFDRLPGWKDASNDANSEFVYSEEKINGVKAQLFNRNSHPGAYLLEEKAIPQATRVQIVYQYLRNDKVSGIYKKVSSRIRDHWYRFGQACKASTIPAYHQYDIDWLFYYDAWETQLLDNMADDIVKYTIFNLESAQADIASTEYATPGVPISQRAFWIDTNVQLKVKEIQAKLGVTLRPLAANG